jgi:hypothetical protein
MWRTIFFVNVPIGVLGVLGAPRFLVVQPGSSTARWDAWGLVTAISGFGASLYATSLVPPLSETASLAFIVVLTTIRGIALGLTVQTPFTAARADVTHAALPRPTSLVSSAPAGGGLALGLLLPGWPGRWPREAQKSSV